MTTDLETALTSTDKNVANAAFKRLLEANELSISDAQILRTDAQDCEVRKKASVFLREPTQETESLLNILGGALIVIFVGVLMYLGYRKLERMYQPKVSSPATITASAAPSKTQVAQTDDRTSKSFVQNNDAPEEHAEYKYECMVVQHNPLRTLTGRAKDKSFACVGEGYIDLTFKDKRAVHINIRIPNTSNNIVLHDGELLVPEQGDEADSFQVKGTWSKLYQNGETTDSGEYDMRVTKGKAEAKLFRTKEGVKKDAYTITISE